MNQILLENNDSNKNGNISNMRNIIIFFSIAVLVFALAIVGVYTYKIYRNQNSTVAQNPAKPSLTLEEKDGNVTIVANSEIGLSKIIYIWNNEEPTEIDVTGRKSHEEQLNIPEGNNTLNVKVIDLNNQEIETNKDLYKENNELKPTIEIDETIGNGKAKIVAKDENAPLKYITYQWNDEEPVYVEADNDNQNVIETTIDIKRGNNKLVITAVNSQGAEEKLDKRLTGVNNPVIDVVKDGGTLRMKVSHDMGFEKIEYNLNGNVYVYNEEYSEYDSSKEDVEFVFNLMPGENTIIIVATSNENTQAEYKGKCNYIVEE